MCEGAVEDARALAFESVDVVQEQDVHGPEAAAERLGPLLPHGSEVSVREVLCGGVLDGEPGVVGVVPDRVQQVRLPQPNAAVDEQRVIG